MKLQRFFLLGMVGSMLFVRGVCAMDPDGSSGSYRKHRRVPSVYETFGVQGQTLFDLLKDIPEPEELDRREEKTGSANTSQPIRGAVVASDEKGACKESEKQPLPLQSAVTEKK